LLPGPGEVESFGCVAFGGATELEPMVVVSPPLEP